MKIKGVEEKLKSLFLWIVADKDIAKRNIEERPFLKVQRCPLSKGEATGLNSSRIFYLPASRCSIPGRTDVG